MHNKVFPPETRRTVAPIRRQSHKSAVRGRPARLQYEQLEPRLALTVVISEFLTENESGLRDVSAHRHDWIELKNAGVEAVDLAGWRLTDDAADLDKFVIPDAGPLTVLDPGETLLIFASGNNGEVGVVDGQVHANFQLSQEPGYLALVEGNGVTIADAFDLYPQQTPDVSYGFGVDVATATMTTEMLVDDSTRVTVISPVGPDSQRDDHWKERGYDDSAWLSGIGSVGFDRNGEGPDLSPYIGRVLTTGEMNSADSTPQYSAYVRYEFDVSDSEQLTSLDLNLRFDDGFIASLNGKEIARANFAEDFVYPQPQWNSYAGHQQGTSSSSGNWNRTADADQRVSFSLTPFLALLEDEGNVLAFHGVNSRSGSGGGTNKLDFLIDAELVAERAGGATQIGFMAKPSPGRENGLAYEGYIEDTKFSVNRGIYETPQTVVITTDEPGATIRYTTDFSEPTLAHGATYVGPIDVSATTVLRARAFKDNYIPTNVDTQTYLFPADVLDQSASDVNLPYASWGHDKHDADDLSGYHLDDESDWEMDPEIVAGNEETVIEALQAIPSLSIVADWDDLFSGTPLPGTGQDSGRVAYEPQGIYIHGRSSERPNSFEYLAADGSQTVQADAVIEIQGHSSPGRWKSDKLSFQVKFKEPLGDPRLNLDLFRGTADAENAVDRFDTLILDAGYNYGWTHANLSVQSDYARFVTDQVTADLQNLATGGAAMHGKFVHLYIDGLYWGIYNIHERPDEHFATDYYSGNDDDALVVKHSTNDVDGLKYTWVNAGLAAEDGYNDLLIASRQNLAVAENYQTIDQILDIQQFIDYMIVHMDAGNENDWPHNNWYATRNAPSPEGQWRFHAWDQEHAFPTDDNGDSFTQFVDLTDDNDEQTPGEIFANLMDSAEFRLAFSDRVEALMTNGGLLTPDVAKAVYEARTDEIDQAIIAESARWGDNWRPNDPYTRDDFIRVKEDLLAAFFPVRTSTVLAQFQTNDWLVDDLSPQLSQYGGDVAPGYELTISNPNSAGTIYYTLDGSDPRDRITGAPSSAATLYGGPITIDQPTRLRARVFADSAGVSNDWSAEVNQTYTLTTSFPLRIVELHYNPVGAEEVLEFIELLNVGHEAIQLDGVQIGSFSAAGYAFTGGQTLAAGERIVVARNPTEFSAAYGAEINLATGPGYAEGNLSNGGETISLLGPVGELLQLFAYDDDPSAGWPADADGAGASLEYIGPLTGDENPLAVSPDDPFDHPANWRASIHSGGSPGTDGEPIIADSADFNGDGAVDGRDFLAWQRGYGLEAPHATRADGDANADADVDGHDLATWGEQFGAHTSAVPSAPQPITTYDDAVDAALAVDWLRTMADKWGMEDLAEEEARRKQFDDVPMQRTERATAFLRRRSSGVASEWTNRTKPRQHSDSETEVGEQQFTQETLSLLASRKSK